MPVFIGDVLESCGGPILDLSGNKVKGIGSFNSLNDRDILGSEFQSPGYISVIDGNVEVYDSGDWDEPTSWKQVAQRFQDYDSIDIDNGLEITSANLASRFVSDTEEDENRYNFAIWDYTDQKFRKLEGGTLEAIILHHFGVEIASVIQQETGNTDAFYTNPDSGLFGDIDGDGIIGVSDILTILSYFGNTSADIERDYLIKFGSNAWPNSNPNDLTYNVYYSNGGLWSSGGYESAFGLLGLSWGNTTNVVGDTGGDDVAFIGNYSPPGSGSYIKIYRNPPPGEDFGSEDPIADNMYAWAQSVTAKVVGGPGYTIDGQYGVANTALDGHIRLFARIRCYGSNGVIQNTVDGTSYVDVNLSNQTFLADDDVQLQLHGGVDPYLGNTPYFNADLATHIVSQWSPADSSIKEIRVTFWYISQDTATVSTGATSQVETLDLGIKVESIQ